MDDIGVGDGFVELIEEVDERWSVILERSHKRFGLCCGVCETPGRRAVMWFASSCADSDAEGRWSSIRPAQEGFIYWSALVPTAAHGTNIKVKPKSATWRTQQSVAVCTAVPDAENARTRATVASTDGDHGCSERWSPVAMSTMGPGEHLFRDVPMDSPAELLSG